MGGGGYWAGEGQITRGSLRGMEGKGEESGKFERDEGVKKKKDAREARQGDKREKENMQDRKMVGK